MIKLNFLNIIKSISYKTFGIILIALMILGFFLQKYPEKTYFSCKVKLDEEGDKGDWYRANVTVNKYFWGRYTLNDYKLSQCEFEITNEIFRERNSVWCGVVGTKHLEFNIIDGRIVRLKDYWGSYTRLPQLRYDLQECTKIKRAVD
jgi:hypothetical protein